MAFDTWESYFYPPPDEGTLRNLFDERDPVVLRELEYVETIRRQRELLVGQVVIPRTYDADHVRAIHRHLFQDVYEWAGEYRGVNIAKGVGRGFGDIKTGEVDQLLDDVRKRVVGTDWGQLDLDAFAERAAVVFAYLNQAHPFREGNGRTSKVFMEHVAELSRFTLDFGQVSPEVWNQASQLSRPDLFSYAPEPASLVPVFHAIAQSRPLTLSWGGRSVHQECAPEQSRKVTRRGLGADIERRLAERPRRLEGGGEPPSHGRGRR